MSTTVLIAVWIADDRLYEESSEHQIMMLMGVWPQAAVTMDPYVGENVQQNDNFEPWWEFSFWNYMWK